MMGRWFPWGRRGGGDVGMYDRNGQQAEGCHLLRCGDLLGLVCRCCARWSRSYPGAKVSWPGIRGKGGGLWPAPALPGGGGVSWRLTPFLAVGGVQCDRCS